MSKVAIKGADTGTGVFTLESPATNTDRTLVLPDEAGTVLTTAGVPASAMPAGSVIQVVQGRTSTQVSSSSNTFADTTLTASITPTSTSNKILVLVNHGSIARIGSASPSLVAMEIVLLKDSTQIYNFGNELLYFTYSTQNGSGTGFLSFPGPSASVLDSPATTSLVTYKTQFRNSIGSTDGVRVQPSSTDSTIVLMEIAA